MPEQALQIAVKGRDAKWQSGRSTSWNKNCWRNTNNLRYTDDTKLMAESEEKLKKLGVPYRMFKGDGIIGNHAWTIVTMFKKAKTCLNDTFDFVLPYLPEYFGNSKESE